MNQISRHVTQGGPRARRTQARSQAFARRGTVATPGERFQTPAWLDHSFVLPVQESAPEHETWPPPDDDSAGRYGSMGFVPAREWPEFVRPPTDEIDFAQLVKRADIARVARRTTTLASACCLVALTAFLLTGSPAALSLLWISVCGGAAAALALVFLRVAPLPHMRG